MYTNSASTKKKLLGRFAGLKDEVEEDVVSYALIGFLHA